MKIKIITVGKLKHKHWQLAEKEYTSRIERYVQLEQVVVKNTPADSYKNVVEALASEAGSILAKIAADEFLVALAIHGEEWHSEQLTAWLREKMLHGCKKITFVVGGASGLSEEILDKAQLQLSLSKMTLPHEMAKVVLLEQLYRAFSILNGEKYHK
ncbi:MAG: 23S rRNA (pseudouridine(1915)-N(3))-methyltransferase RlmH [bacterium]